ncbi:murein transglycosylase [Pseudohongiella nitratireducens]|uniref:Murein transglycosylase n=1 Tax=Pseudohongiella nitratireducens TaxID=1768907 RepID=A0A917LTN5_9GAMM|nr:lytic murein transglycosylase [Pseudohongiella nitratireducens]GGG54660.1 murein transglycosylase [Pseudohongiella nitratireducens]
MFSSQTPRPLSILLTFTCSFCLIMATFTAPLAVLAQDTGAEPDSAEQEAAFQAWLTEFREEALSAGISENTLEQVIPTIQQQRRVVAADRSQAEFDNSYDRYLQRVNTNRIEAGRHLMQTQGSMIREVAAEYGVQPRFIVAILGLESNYGTFPITEPLFSVIATLAFDGRRGDMFRRELLAALEIVDKGFATPEMMKSSWAGALGIAQFMPSSYLNLAVDHDEDGKIDLWSMGPDVIATVANYLKSTGWRDDQTWGRPVSLPSGGEQSLPAPQSAGMTPESTCRSYRTMGAWRPLEDWQQLGVRRSDGSPLPARNLPAALLIADEGDDQGYLVYRNFCSIMRYNPAFRYALTVGLLSDAIAGINN